MKKEYKLIFVLFIVMVFCSVCVVANTYDPRAEGIRVAIWAWDIPAFSNHTVPEKYAGESAVILARHRYIRASGERGSFAREFFTGNIESKVFYTDIDRYMIKINDQAALNYYTEFSYREVVKKSVYGNTDEVKTVVGIRIIKPDSTIKEIDVSTYAVSVTEGRKDKEAYKKLAIPGLEIGDILDMFVYELSVLGTMNIPPQIISFYSLEYPCLSSSVHCEFGDDITVEYRSVNGAPDIESSKDEYGCVVLDAEMQDVICVKGIEILRWASFYRDLPMIRLQVLQNASRVIFKPSGARPSGVHKDIPYETILKDTKEYFAKGLAYVPMSGDFIKRVNAAIQNYKQKHPAVGNDELASYIYSVLNFYWPGNEDTTEWFMFVLGRYLLENKIEFKYGFTTSRYSARKGEVACSTDLFCVIMANGNTQLFVSPYRYLVTGYVPGAVEGETVSSFAIKKFGPRGIRKLEMEEFVVEYNVPVTTAEQNRVTSKLDISFSQDDPLCLVIDRHTAWKGSDKEKMQDLMVTYEKWDSVMRRSLSIEKTLIEELAEKSKTKKQIDEVFGAFEEGRETYKERIEGEIYMYHMANAEQILQYSIQSYGVTSDSPDLEYSVKYTLNGLVKKAGDNLILDAGKLAGYQWVPSESERNRIIDAYLPTARMSDYEIAIRIPEGYQVQDAGMLNYRFENEYGIFEATAATDNNILNLKVKKVYARAYVPSRDWDKLMGMIDSANRFYSHSIVLRKI